MMTGTITGEISKAEASPPDGEPPDDQAQPADKPRSALAFG